MLTGGLRDTKNRSGERFELPHLHAERLMIDLYYHRRESLSNVF